ncbi:hypothetical protein [Lysobacter capsici]|uniref:hypothetical protein n=1 Tax=Lysobacter capsici TaxID=435897 RepID=UPI001C001BFD|nr:hypothetical protein [Lysobacter capsici]QWF17148.1 hypothetical protein KME82_26060 [Lysobacter capsici]
MKNRSAFGNQQHSKATRTGSTTELNGNAMQRRSEPTQHEANQHPSIIGFKPRGMDVTRQTG